ncbi:putative cyclin-dependent kinase inhibitor 1-like isoform X3 [Capsicum annuum]|uniref:Uncharacterized protein n=1 Tax=Capsicum annuum TaxID=4072 RepID=A0A2G2ZHP4_CAPAN|nr:putative cyclin-dependent kinase inhibitor 1-like isoform X3 [Capsicum annuum]KAF3683958.1 putative cyclin-dependent kinase inhibitor 1-like isoform X3 [Capsicum annuum]PHT81502.1 hypothetical protein T459_14517 [Capsicum annuum]
MIMEVVVKMKRERLVLEVVETRKRKKCNTDLEMLPTTIAYVRSHDSGVSVAPASLELSLVSELTSQENTTTWCKLAVNSNFIDNESNDVTKESPKFVNLDLKGAKNAKGEQNGGSTTFAKDCKDD